MNVSTTISEPPIALKGQVSGYGTPQFKPPSYKPIGQILEGSVTKEAAPEIAEAIDTYKPDIVGIDANEPQVDHYDISQMKFFDNYQKGNGCKTFFEAMKQNALMDAFVKNYDIRKFVEGEYLTTSHIIKRGNKKVRYDFLFINEERFSDYSCEYDYDGAICAGSDHASIVITSSDL
jgi:hypothetical protein